MITALILNSTLLISLAVLFSFLSRGGNSKQYSRQLLYGAVFGTIAVIGMRIPLTFQGGIFYDGRSIILSMAGLFGGYLSGLISLLISLIYRLYIGGEGVWAGSSSIVLSVLWGMLFRKLTQNKPENISILQLFLLGILCTAGVLLSQLLLPESKIWEIFNLTWTTVVLVFPTAGLIMGILFRNEAKRHLTEEQLSENEARFRTTLLSIGDGIITLDTDGVIVFMNPMAYQLTETTGTSVLGRPMNEVFSLVDEETRQPVHVKFSQLIQNKISHTLTKPLLLKTAGGREIPIMGNAAAIKDSKGDVSGIVLVIKDYSEERSLRNQLIESERLFYNLTNRSPVGIFRTSADGYTNYVNPKWCEISGVNEQQAYGFGWLNAIHPDDCERVSRDWEQARKGRGISTCEYRFINTQNQVRWVLGVAVPEFTNQSQLQGYIGTIIDITDRKSAEDAFQQSLENFKRTMGDSPMGIRIVAKSGETSYVNSAFLSLYEYENEQEFAANPISSRYTLESIKAHDARKQLRKNGEQAPHEYKIDIRTKRETIRHLMVTRKLINWDGQIQDLVIYQDITERQQAENRLRLFERAIHQSPASTIITSNEGKIIYTNPKFTETSGYQAHEVIGKTPAFMKSGYHPDDYYKQLWTTIMSGSEWRGEFFNKRKNGELFWERAVISSIINEKGEITNFVEVKEDVTEKKKIIQDLQQAKEKAEESDRLKSAFLANMSHEILTPLNAIIGFTNLLLKNEGLAEDQKKEFSSIINNSSEDLLQIINDILDISKIETGQLHMFPTEFSVHKVVQELYSIACRQQEKMEKTVINIQYQLSPNDYFLLTDKARFMQVFNNLINNAIKFTNEGNVKFGISDVSPGQIRFFVSDTGIGIGQPLQERIFDRFRQVDDSLSHSHGGTGLGLSISKKLVEQMGGEISLESAPGKGTTFWFTIPLANMAEPENTEV
ncbi:MAG: PAS domain S-box protein [Mangrovibacterium sp.]